jgi:tRNA U34 5-methylaminomethyl-2-thiouridine-forming methyltransferase MnmC
LYKLQTTFEFFRTTAIYDLVYFDAFAPSKQPEIWNITNFKKIYERLTPGGLLVSYCAQSAFRRSLKQLGFQVYPLPGSAGKKEMTLAIK